MLLVLDQETCELRRKDHIMGRARFFDGVHHLVFQESACAVRSVGRNFSPPNESSKRSPSGRRHVRDPLKCRADNIKQFNIGFPVQELS